MLSDTTTVILLYLFTLLPHSQATKHEMASLRGLLGEMQSEFRASLATLAGVLSAMPPPASTPPSGSQLREAGEKE